MPSQNRSVAKARNTASSLCQGQGNGLRVLVVDPDRKVGDRVLKCLGDPDATIVFAGTAAEALERLTEASADLALIEADLPDGSGLDLAATLRAGKSAPQTLVMTDNLSVDRALAAMRAGAGDVVVKPIRANKQTREQLAQAVERVDQDRQRRSRYQRLRRVCKRMSSAREEVIEQVNILCNDLVSAYQDLANQMQQVVQTNEYACLAGQELDLEKLLRRTLEYLLEKVGPTNMAIFLPASADEYSLGGYVNYDSTTESHEVLLQLLADQAAPLVADRDGLVHITDNDTLEQWIGDDLGLLPDRHVVAFPCTHEGEALAIVVMYRDQAQPFGPGVLETCNSVGPMIGGYLGKVIRVHHRHIPELEDEEYWP